MMKHNWEIKNISTVFNFDKGVLQSSKNTAGQFRFITASEEFKTHNKYYYDTEALCFAFAASGSLGRTHYVNGKFTASDLVYVMTPKDDFKDRIELRFHFYFLNHFKDEIVRMTKSGTSKASINRAAFSAVQVPLPPLIVQDKILTTLEKVKSRLDEIEQLRLEQAKEMNNLRYSLMCSVESKFPKERIDVVCHLKKGAFPIMKTDAGEYPFVVTAAEFKTANNFDFDCEATCVPLVSSTGHGNAAMHRVHYASGKFALSNLLCAVMPKDKKIVNAKFLYELFMAKKDEYFVPIMAGTSNVSLNPGKLGAVEIPIPPIEEQNRIVELLEKINEIKQTHKEQEAELKQLMPSLLDKAFKGEL